MLKLLPRKQGDKLTRFGSILNAFYHFLHRSCQQNFRGRLFVELEREFGVGSLIEAAAPALEIIDSTSLFRSKSVQSTSLRVPGDGSYLK